MSGRPLHLTRMSVTCRLCGQQFNVMEESREVGDRKVMDLIERHLAESHGVDLEGSPLASQLSQASGPVTSAETDATAPDPDDARR